jgi:apolipoprotein N-acyltransferase
LIPWTGVYGATFAVALANVALMKRRFLVAVILASIIFWSRHPAPARAARQAVVVQPNIPMDVEWTPETALALQRRLEYLTISAAKQGQADLLVWPEVPAPLYYETDPQFRNVATMIALLTRTPFLFGTVGFTSKSQPLNSAVMLASDGRLIDRYSKVELVPFGEYVPFPWANIVPKVTNEVSDFSPGSKLTTFNVNGHKISVFICYESAFPDFVRRFQGEVLFNLSNDGYFGKHAAREQHLQLVRTRAIENAIWIVRSTNDGITASIDPRGIVTSQLPPYTEIAGRLPFEYRQQTTFYHRYGDWFAAVSFGFVVLSYAGLRVRRRP